MLLKNLMEEEKQQLNYDRPLLSVRRLSPTVASEKDNNNTRKTDKSLPGIPRLPRYKTELKSGPVTNPGTVPFLWEQRPGRPKEEIKVIKPHDENTDRPPIIPKLPPGKSSVVNKIIEKESAHSGDSDEAYADALDTFSSTESIFYNCSTSGLSSLDEFDVKVKPSGTFSTDPWTRDFMMTRFLPAAKAMASDTPQFATKKQPIVQEKPRQIQKIVSRDRSSNSTQHGPSLVKHYLQFQDNKEEEESDEVYDRRGNLPAVRGFLPRFCLNHSFCLINPVTATSMRTRLPKSSVNKLQDRSSAASSSFRKRDDEPRSNFSDRDSVGNQISSRTEFNSNSRQRQNPDGSLLHRQLQEHCTSKSFDESPNEEKGVIIFPEETKNLGINGFRLHKKGSKTFRDFLSEESYSGIPAVEKTLYLDTAERVKSPSREPFSANLQGSNEQPGSREKECKVFTKMMMDQSPLVDCSLKDIEKMKTVGGEKLLSDSQKCTDIVVESSTNNSNQKGGIDASEAENREKFHQSRFQIPVPPPSPISPSASWLQQTMSSKNSDKRSHLGAAANPEKQVSKAQPGDLKWETLVRTTKVQQH